MSLEHPLTNDDFDQLEHQLKQANEITKAIAKARSAGLNMDDADKTNKENIAKIRQLLATYNRPPA